MADPGQRRSASSASADRVWYAQYRLPAGPPGQGSGRAGVDRAGAAAGRLLHEARSPRTGCATSSARGRPQRAGRGAAGVASPDRRRRSPRRPRNTCASPRRTAAASRRRSATTASRSTSICCRCSARWRIEDITEREIERWRAGMSSAPAAARALEQDQEQPARADARDLPARGQALRAAGATRWPASTATACARSGDIEVFSPEEVWSLVRAAASETDGGDLPDRRVHRPAPRRAARAALARRRLRRLDDPGPRELRRRAADDAEVRQGPGRADGARRRERRSRGSASGERFTGDDDFVFAGESGLPLDGDALSSRYRDALARAGLRPLRFHDLRHTFGTRMIAKADIRRVQEWMGHADIQTTMKYLHYASRARTRSWSRRRLRPRRQPLGDRIDAAQVC